jgi:D-glycero-beta-D-manno-heptose-7-phosphate kinase
MDLFKNKKILIVGDVMLDSYLFGNVERISPEAPVPIVDIIVKQDKLGGAANVASNIKNLGGTPILCSVIGKDQKGDIFISLLKKMKISTNYIYQSQNRITTNKTRIIGNNHQMLRIDEEIKNELNSDESLYISMVRNAIKNENFDCILFQDYDKGVLNPEIISNIITIAKTEKIPTIVDPKKNNYSHYNNVTLFKPNFKEFKESLNLSNLDKLNRKELLVKGAETLHKKGIEIVFITLSENGIFISYKKDKKLINKIIPGVPRDVVDVSGAGDTVASVTAMLINDLSIEEIANIANLAGGIVCEEVGVEPINKERLLKEYYILKK